MDSNTPLNENDLHTWIKENLHLNIPRTPVCPHHDAPFDYIKHVYFETDGDVVVWAPRGGGKTTLGAVATLLDLLFKPKCHSRILGGSLEQSLRMWESLLPMLEDIAPNDLADQRTRSRRLRMNNGAAAAVLTQSQRCVRGQRVQKLRCDEVELFKPEIWSAAQLVTRSRNKMELPAEAQLDWPTGYRARIEALSTLHEPHGLMQEIIDTAAARGAKVFRWCLLDVLEKCPPERDCATCPLHADCQGAARSADGFFRIDDAITMKKRVCKETWEAEMLCLRPSRKDAVFSAFAPARHVSEQSWWKDDLEVKRTLAIDFGYRMPFVCLWLLHDRTGRVFVMDELVVREHTLEKVIQLIQARHVGFRKVFCDPAGDNRNAQTSHSDVTVFRNAGFSVRHKRTKVQDGIEQIKAALDPAAGVPTLRIHPCCKELIRSMECYHYKKDQGDERPLKDGINDHSIDALRYFYVNRTLGEEGAGVY
jgi:hypothetical protein